MRKTIYSIQTLRGLAASMVVFFHAQVLIEIYMERYGIQAAVLNSVEPLRIVGASGVDIFFAISGFIMAYITHQQRGSFKEVMPFLKRRFIRILPLYWFYLSVFVLLLISVPHLFNRAVFNWHDVIYSYLLVPYTSEANPTAPLIGLAWTLWYELFFYALVALGLFMREKTFILLIGLLFLFTVFLLPQLASARFALILMLNNPVLFEFLAGFICGVVFLSELTLPKWLASIFFILTLTLYVAWFVDYPQIPVGFASTSLVAFAIVLEKSCVLRIPSFLIELGNSSYSIYLSHCLVLPALGKMLAAAGAVKTFSPDFLIVVLTVCCIILGYILFVVVEKPLIRCIRRISE